MVYSNANAQSADKFMVFGHGGSDGTLALAFPEQDLMAFYFTQSRGGWSMWEFESFLAPLVGLPAPQAHQRLSTNQLEAYVGQYRDNDDGDFTYAYLRDDRLVFEIPAKFPNRRPVVPNWPSSDGLWAFGPAVPNVVWSFDAEPTGNVSRLRIMVSGKEDTVLVKVGPTKDLPTVEELMTLVRKGNGDEHINALQTLHLQGKITTGKASGTISVLARQDGVFLRRTKIGNIETVLQASADRAWSQTTGNPTEELAGMFREQFLGASPFRVLCDWRRFSGDIEVVRKDKLSEEDVWVVRIGGKLLPPSTRYVSCKSGRLLGEDGWFTAKGAGVLPMTTRFEDYRDVDGVFIPFRVVSQKPYLGLEVVQYEDAKANPELPEGNFHLPVSWR
jgi:hypothetical protein